MPFFEWVTTLRAADNPRGDFIRDTRAAFKIGGKACCEYMVLCACPEAQHERDKLWREWKIAYWKFVDESRFDLFPKEQEIPA